MSRGLAGPKPRQSRFPLEFLRDRVEGFVTFCASISTRTAFCTGPGFRSLHSQAIFPSSADKIQGRRVYNFRRQRAGNVTQAERLVKP